MKKLLQQPGFHIMLFICGILLFSWPYWSSEESRVPGNMYIYLFAAWFLVIVVLFFISLALGEGKNSGGDSRERGRDADV